VSKSLVLSAAALLTVLAAIPAQAADTPMLRVGGVGLNVSDMDKSLKFYTQAVGLKVALRVPAQGAPKEIALTVSGDLTSGGALVVLANIGTPPKPGHETFGRVIINSPDTAAIAKRVTDLGYKANQMGAGMAPKGPPAYFLIDPDGNKVELYPATAAQMK
jgi:catechol-2,3-dioxygenase